MTRTPGQQIGRTRTTGSGKAPKQFKRVAISYRHKRDVIEYHDAIICKDKMHVTVSHFYHSLTAAQINSKKRQIYNWLDQRELIIENCETGCGSHCNDRKVGASATLPRELEQHILMWINSLRKEGVPVTGSMVRMQAKDCYDSAGLPSEKFAASHTWLRSFLRRNRLSIRRRTRQSQKTPEDAAEVAKKFGDEIRQKMKQLGIDKVYNADQTGKLYIFYCVLMILLTCTMSVAINYEYLPGKTVAGTGDKTVWMKSAGKDKDRVTLMLLGDSHGVKYDPFLVFKTKPSVDAHRAWSNTAFQHGFGAKLWRELHGEQNGVQLYGNSAGWWNSDLTIQFMIYHFLKRDNMHVPILLLLDDFSGHWRQDVQIFARLLNIELMPIPAGYTFACQPADISWNKPLKDTMRKNWVEKMLRQLRSSTATIPFKLKAPSRQQLVIWTKAAWNSLSAEVVKSGFAKANIISKQGGHVDATIQYLLDTEPDWNLFSQLLDRVPTGTHTVEGDFSTLKRCCSPYRRRLSNYAIEGELQAHQYFELVALADNIQNSD